MRRRTQVRVSQWILFGIWSVILAGMFFAAGRASTPYRAINALPDGQYTVRSIVEIPGGRVLSLVANKEGLVRIIDETYSMPATFDVVSNSNAKARGYGNEYCPGYHVIDMTSDKPKPFWSNLYGYSKKV